MAKKFPLESESLLDIIRRATPLVERAEWDAELMARNASHSPRLAQDAADRLAQTQQMLREMRAVVRYDRGVGELPDAAPEPAEVLPSPDGGYDDATETLSVTRPPLPMDDDDQRAWMLLLAVARYLRLRALRAPAVIVLREKHLIVRRAVLLLTGVYPTMNEPVHVDAISYDGLVVGEPAKEGE